MEAWWCVPNNKVIFVACIVYCWVYPDISSEGFVDQPLFIRQLGRSYGDLSPLSSGSKSRIRKLML